MIPRCLRRGCSFCLGIILIFFIGIVGGVGIIINGILLLAFLTVVETVKENNKYLLQLINSDKAETKQENPSIDNTNRNLPSYKSIEQINIIGEAIINDIFRLEPNPQSGSEEWLYSTILMPIDVEHNIF